MAKDAIIASSVGLAVTHRRKDRHGPDGGVKPEARHQAMLAAVEDAVADGLDEAETRAAILAERDKHRTP